MSPRVVCCVRTALFRVVVVIVFKADHLNLFMELLLGSSDNTPHDAVA